MAVKNGQSYSTQHDFKPIIYQKWRRENVENIHQQQSLAFAPCCLNARGDSTLQVSGGLERLSRGSSWRGYLYPFIPPAPVAGGRFAASG